MYFTSRNTEHDSSLFILSLMICIYHKYALCNIIQFCKAQKGLFLQMASVIRLLFNNCLPTLWKFKWLFITTTASLSIKALLRMRMVARAFIWSNKYDNQVQHHSTSSGKFFSLLLSHSWPFPRTCREETGGRKRHWEYVCYLQEHILPNCFTFWQISVSLIPSLLKKYRWNLYPKVTDDWANQRQRSLVVLVLTWFLNMMTWLKKQLNNWKIPEEILQLL